MPQLIPTIYEWEVVLPPDVTAPDTTITNGPPPITANTIVLLEMVGHDDQTHELEMEFECRLDNGPWESCDPLEEIEVLTRGPHRIEVRAVDETGNVDPTPAFRDFTLIDLSVPDTSIDSGPELRDHLDERDVHVLRRGGADRRGGARVRVRARRRRTTWTAPSSPTR